ncbi:hypothetical protein [Acetobacter senegalensis]|uniref:hypothetical protein n=1 Tax=Acetobacter senegalensis TaxID=446692 RepID=UPI00264EB70E|nr:hypothetical protein [Acetobacter senegalensis]MDN7355633.1 hypothetical protein [Acetobacter senegalensis]
MEKDPLSRRVLGWTVVLGALVGSIGVIGFGNFQRSREAAQRQHAAACAQADPARRPEDCDDTEQHGGGHGVFVSSRRYGHDGADEGDEGEGRRGGGAGEESAGHAGFGEGAAGHAGGGE